MELAAILVVGGFSELPIEGMERNAPTGTAFSRWGSFASQPLLGLPVVDRMANMLQTQGVGRIAVLSETKSPVLPQAVAGQRSALEWQQVKEGQIWRQAENVFTDLAQGADEVLVLQLANFLELDLQDLLAHHYEHRCRVTSTVSPNGERLHAYVISANRRNDAATLFRSGLEQIKTPCTEFTFRGYYSPLRTAADFRRLTIDALLEKVSIRPLGASQVRPGVWLDLRAQVDPSARLVPPVYVGECARVMAGALVTRCAVLEHRTTVCRGSVVENATLLPFTRLGEKLELRNSVACGSSLVHLRHSVAMQVDDSRLLAAVPEHGLARTGQLLSRLTLSSLRSLQRLTAAFSSAEKASEYTKGSSPRPAHAGAENNSDDQDGFTADVVGARRYGEQ